MVLSDHKKTLYALFQHSPHISIIISIQTKVDFVYSRFQLAFEKSLRMFVCKFVVKFQCLF